MRQTLLAIIVLTGLSAAGRADETAGLRLNQIQTVGTAESYKLRPSEAVLSLIRSGGDDDARALDYALPPLAAQLDAGARTLEFDVAYDPKGGLFKYPAAASMAGELLDDAYVAAMRQPGFKVIHVLDVDYNSQCLTLLVCLDAVARWSRGHPGHAPILIALHANDARTPIPGATRPLPFDAAAMDALDAEIRGVFSDDTLITPDMVQGKAASLREAVTAGRWPSLAAARGKVMLVLDGEAGKGRLYQGARRGLEGRAMFVAADEDSPLASVLFLDDPRKQMDRIVAAVKAGFIVRTRADEDAAEARQNNPDRRIAAFASGAQFIATDFILPDAKIGPYKVGLADDPRFTGADFALLPAAVQTATVH